MAKALGDVSERGDGAELTKAGAERDKGYANAADRKYDSLDLSPQLIEQTLREMQAQATVHRVYEQVLAQHAARKLRLSSITSGETSLANATPKYIRSS